MGSNCEIGETPLSPGAIASVKKFPGANQVAALLRLHQSGLFRIPLTLGRARFKRLLLHELPGP